MFAIKVKFQISDSLTRTGRVYYYLSYGGKVYKVKSGHQLRSDEWNERRATPVAGTDSGRNAELFAIKHLIEADVERMRRVVYRLGVTKMDIAISDVVREYQRVTREYMMMEYMRGRIDELHRSGRVRTAEIYRTALNSFYRFRSGEDIHIDAISPEVIADYEAYLKCRGNSANTTSFYMRVLRAVYMRAVGSGAVNDRRPFKGVYTGVQRTIKRALPLSVVKRIRNAELDEWPHVKYARDMFMFSFYLRGMSFIDMAYLRKTDLSGGYLHYRRRKTGQLLRIKWTPQMQALIDDYPRPTSQYLLPIIMRQCRNERSVYRNVGYNINRNLKKLAQIIGLESNLTMYCARHSWATAARAKGVPLSVISEGLGHDSESTTQIYLASVDTSEVDKANAMIIGSLR